MSLQPSEKEMFQRLGCTEPLKLHYFNFPQHARAGYIRLLLTDAGVPFEEEIYTAPKTSAQAKEDWEVQRNTLITGGMTPMGRLPILLLGSRYLTQSVPTLKYLAKRLGPSYSGKNAEEEYLADVVSDITVDWLVDHNRFFLNGNEEMAEKYVERQLPIYLQALEENYVKGSENGPFLLGENPVYADFMSYCTLSDRHNLIGSPSLASHPRLGTMYQSMASRPRIAAFLEQRRNATESDA